MGLYRNGSGEGLPTDVLDLFDSARMWCAAGYSEINGVLSGHVVLVSTFGGCDLIMSPINEAPTPPDTCDMATLLTYLQGLGVDTEFDVGAIAYDPGLTNADYGLSAPGFGVYSVDTDIGVLTLIIIAHTCY